MHHEVILGTPFLALLYPFQVTEKGIITEVIGRKIMFEFISPPKSRELNIVKNSSISLIKNKTKQINSLHKEIHYKRIEEQLQNKVVSEPLGRESTVKLVSISSFIFILVICLQNIFDS